MDRTAFSQMAAIERTHWWFVGRRAVIDALLDGVPVPEHGQILEAGCGTGGNLASLARRGNIAAFEPHIDALAFARTRHPGIDIREAALPHPIPYDPASFDLVAALDVLEHVDDDVESAISLAGLVRPGGWLIVTVPAHQFLWGSHDRRLHHIRRYGLQEVLALFPSSELELVRCSPFNFFLSPVAIGYRLLEKLLRVDLGSQERRPPRVLNVVLTRIFRLEATLIRAGVRLPAGISYAAVFRKRSNS